MINQIFIEKSRQKLSKNGEITKMWEKIDKKCKEHF